MSKKDQEKLAHTASGGEVLLDAIIAVGCLGNSEIWMPFILDHGLNIKGG